MRIAIAGIHNEASGFSLHSAGHDFFTWARGGEILDMYDFATNGAGDLTGVEFVPTVVAMGGASGPVQPEVFDEALNGALDGLRAALESGPLDGVYLHMHGAVGVAGREMAEEAYVGAVRDLVGPDVVIGMSMDPHGNLSEELISLVDVACVHRFSPHTDNLATTGRTIAHIVRILRTGVKPAVAWARVPVLLPGERTSTFVEPGNTVFGTVPTAIAEHGLDDAGLWVGFAWADEPRNAAAAVAFGASVDDASAAAAELAQAYWDAREGFVIVSEHSGSWSDALEFVLGGAQAPVWISDSGDNVTAGSVGDITYALRSTLDSASVVESGKSFLFTGIFDPASLAAAQEAGIGASLDIAVGAKGDARYAGPVAGPWEVVQLVEGLRGEGVVGAVLRQGTIDVIVQSTRQRYVAGTDSSASHRGTLNAAIIDSSGYDAVVVKNGYLFETQIAAAGSIFMAITPGGTDLDFDRLAFTRRAVPMFPWERSFSFAPEPVIVRPGGPVAAVGGPVASPADRGAVSA
jgi:microcystin degradation protein MlrC